MVAEALALAALPDLVVAAAEKDIDRTARHLGCRPAAAYLWDDNPALRGRPRVTTVPAFDRLPSDQHARLSAFLARHLPQDRLPADLADFLLTANPRDCLLRPGPHGRLTFSLPSSPMPSQAYSPWPVPPELCRGSESGRVQSAGVEPGLRPQGRGPPEAVQAGGACLPLLGPLGSSELVPAVSLGLIQV